MAEDAPIPPTDPATQAAPPASPVSEAPAPLPAEASTESEGLASLDQLSIEELLKQASFEDPSAVGLSPDATAANIADFKLPNFQQVMKDAQVSSIDLLRDVELNVKIELGRSRMLVEDVLKLSEGSVVELDKLAGDPVDVFVNDRLVARGEVLVLNDNFCVRVNEIVAGIKEEGF
ncbi:MAG TPA: flagellar motor switch protein FliN [Tepidisphaeraceae bacterium]|nr:flagellar motor switch protein FliN [Tepidisphaeraceae bacterium]